MKRWTAVACEITLWMRALPLLPAPSPEAVLVGLYQAVLDELPDGLHQQLIAQQRIKPSTAGARL